MNCLFVLKICIPSHQNDGKENNEKEKLT
jgi:hypothetical protein